LVLQAIFNKANQQLVIPNIQALLFEAFSTRAMIPSWIQSHTFIPGNTTIDAALKEETTVAYTPNTPINPRITVHNTPRKQT